MVFISRLTTRCAPTSYKWKYTPYKGPYAFPWFFLPYEWSHGPLGKEVFFGPILWPTMSHLQAFLVQVRWWFLAPASLQWRLPMSPGVHKTKKLRGREMYKCWGCKKSWFTAGKWMVSFSWLLQTRVRLQHPSRLCVENSLFIFMKGTLLTFTTHCYSV